MGTGTRSIPFLIERVSPCGASTLRCEVGSCWVVLLLKRFVAGGSVDWPVWISSLLVAPMCHRSDLIMVSLLKSGYTDVSEFMRQSPTAFSLLHHCVCWVTREFLKPKKGVNRIRPDVMKRRLRVVVDQWATLKADHNF